ncbi:hypothetical protein FAZ95_24435 [Trinickia violacea]|uniref:Lipoprotein n=1 Tax=Trinickia violacea TaxID=2571746 RepID=A0A4P8ITA1_9BURK|nr:hypothetical protein [Trinickia violacea]QCP52332.1 hypothetical protein FAZ95_24435 [Trinickia violacea]
MKKPLNSGLVLAALLALGACHSSSDSPLARAAAAMAKTEAPRDAQWVKLDSSDKVVQECSIKFPESGEPWTGRLALKQGEYAIHARLEQDGTSGVWSSGEVWSDAKTDLGKDTVDENVLRTRLHNCVAHTMALGMLASTVGPDSPVVAALREQERQEIDAARTRAASSKTAN